MEADVRDFHLNQRYAFIFAHGDVFNFMLTCVDQEAMLAGVREHLADGGQFLFDTLIGRPDHMVSELERKRIGTLLLTQMVGKSMRRVEDGMTICSNGIFNAVTNTGTAPTANWYGHPGN